MMQRLDMGREVFDLVGKIVRDVATKEDRQRLEHLTWLRAKSLKRVRK